MNKIIKFGDNIDTDTIIPGQYCNIFENESLGRYCMHNVYKDFYKQVKQGDVIIAGENFGCGSSREMAPLAIKETGIELIIAKSFSRIFMRNAINIGLQLIQDEKFYELSKDGDEISINNMYIKNVTNGLQLEFKHITNPVYKKISGAGGIMQLAKKIINGETEI